MTHKLLLLSLAMASINQAWALDYHVSPSGDDKATGSIQAPFKTIIGARNAIRTLPSKERQQDITVNLHSGTYRQKSTLIFNIIDGAPDGYKVTYQAAKGANPIISSAVDVNGWQKLNSSSLTAVPEGLPKAAISHVWQADMPEEVTNFFVMFENERMLKRARGEGFQSPKQNFKKFATRNTKNLADRYLNKRLEFPQGTIKNWRNLEDVEVFFTGVPWTQSISPIASVDLEKRVATLKYEGNTPPSTTPKPDHPSFIENVVDVLDQPGEWVVNTQTRKIYYWPLNNKKPANIQVPTLKELVRIEGDIDYDGAQDTPVKNMVFNGITFTKADRYEWWDDHKGWGIQHDWDKFDHGNALLRLRGAENIEINQSRFTNTGSSAIRMDLHAQNNTVKNSLIDHVGHMGILLAGYGPGTKDVNKNNRIINNIISHTGEIIWHGHAIFIWQSGENYVANNSIQNVPRKAVGICGVRGAIFQEGKEVFWDEASKTMRWHEIKEKKFKGNKIQQQTLPYLHARNNLVENNYVYRARTKIGDGAALNISGAGEGNVMRRNMLYMSLGNGMRFDDWQRGSEFSENLILSGGVVHKGNNNLFNNIFLNSTIRFSLYPGQQPDPGSKVQNNLMYFTKGGAVPYKGRQSKTINTPESLDLQNNAYFSVNESTQLTSFINTQQQKGLDTGSKVTNPLFVKPLDLYTTLSPDDFAMKDDSPLYDMGFKKIDTSKIGLTKQYPEHFKALVFPKERGRLISQGAKITYSSMSDKVKVSDLAALLNTGKELSTPTIYESRNEATPWVMLELKEKEVIDGLYIQAHAFDRQNSLRGLTVWVSEDGNDWQEIWHVDSDHVAMGRDWQVNPFYKYPAKFVKIGLKPKELFAFGHHHKLGDIKNYTLKLKNIQIFTKNNQAILAKN